MNIGAEVPWDSGYYFWWGDTIGYKRVGSSWVASDGSSSSFSFSGGNAPTYGMSSSTLKSEGWITEDGVLASDHDAAQAQWGGGWRMPTVQDLNDLCYNKCVWIWTTTNGVNGYLVRGKDEYSSASIFLPCTGYGSGNSRTAFSSHGYYWSSVPASSVNNAGGIVYLSYRNNIEYTSARDAGIPIRPVWNASPDAMIAAAAEQLIAAIGEVAYTDESKAKIDAARAAYNALTDAQKALVANYATLMAAEEAYAALAPEPGPCYQMLDESDITAPYAAPKAVTLLGAAYDGCDVVGIVELKLGKVNAKKKTSKVSGSVTTLDGKKHTIKGVTVTGIDGTAPAVVSLAVKDLGTLSVTIGGTQFAGTLGGTYHVQSASVGGTWAGGTATATVEINDGDLDKFPGTLLATLLPDGETATVKNSKWTFAKAATVKWAKAKGAAEKSLIVDTSKGKTNLSGLKLTYTPKKGTFKGSFKVYALDGSGKTVKLNKYTFNVSGFVFDGVGYGKATCKKPSVSWSVTVE